MTGSVRIAFLAGCILAVSGFQTAEAGFQWTAPIGGVATSQAPAAPTTGSVMPRSAERAPRAAAAPISPVTSESLPSDLGSISAGAPIATMPDGPANAAPIFGSGMTNDPITWNPTHSQIQGEQQNAQMMHAPRAPQAAPMAAPYNPGTGAPMPLNAQIMAQPAPTMNAPVMAAPMTAQAGYGAYDVAQGFGRDLPLVMAIRQIVPPQYGFVFEEGIDVSTSVSWQGGRPWDLVLQDTVAPLSLRATINGNTVAIGRAAPVVQMGGLQMASAMGTAAGPQVSSDMMAGGGDMMMTATPVAMSAPATAPSGPVIMDGVGNGGYMSPAAYNQADLMATTTWTAPRNSTLRTILEDWSKRVGVELYWASEYDYPVQSAVSLQGTFEDAVQTLLKGLTESKPRPTGRLHPNLPNGPAVLVIETRQNSM